MALIVAAGLCGLVLVAVLAGSVAVTGAPESTAAIEEGTDNLTQIGRVLFTDYVFAFEVTAALLTIAVVGAVVLVRRPSPTREEDR